MHAELYITTQTNDYSYIVTSVLITKLSQEPLEAAT